MSSHDGRQFCAICAWRETCVRKFSVADGGARCPDFTRDISIRTPAGGDTGEKPGSGTAQGE